MNCRDVIEQVQVLLGDPHGDYHTQAGLLIQVNQALRDISSRSRSVREKQFHAVKSGQYEYGLMSGFLEMHIVGFYHVDWYQLSPTTIASIEGISSWVSSNIPWNYDVWGNVGVDRITEADVATASTTENEITLDMAYTDIRAGDRIINLSDEESEGIVQMVSIDGTETTIEYNNLLGGDRNTLTADDKVRIVSPEKANKMLVIAPPPDFNDAAGEESLWVYVSRLHREFKQIDLDRCNDCLELDIELENALLHRTLFYARGGELGFKDQETQSHAVMYESSYHTAMPHVRTRLKQVMSTWKKGLSRSGRGDTVNEYGTAPAAGHPFNRGRY